MTKKYIYEKVSLKRLKDYPFETNIKKPYFVEIDTGDNVFIEEFDKKDKAKNYMNSLKSKSKRVYLN